MNSKRLIGILLAIVIALYLLYIKSGTTNESYVLPENFEGTVFIMHCVDKEKKYKRNRTYVIPDSGILAVNNGKEFGGEFIHDAKFYSGEMSKTNRLSYVEYIEDIGSYINEERIVFRFQTGVTFNKCMNSDIEYSKFIVSKPDPELIGNHIKKSDTPNSLKRIQDECFCD